MMTGENFIGNERSAEGTNQFRTINPQLNAENDWLITEATDAEIDRAVNLAWAAFATYRKTSATQRASFLENIAREMEQLGDQLIQIYCKESGLPESRAKVELTRTMFQLHTFAELLRTDQWRETSIDEAIPDRQPVPKVDLRKTYIPLGPVAVFGSSNFPLAYSTAGGDTASALAAGCPVVVKSHPMHAGTGELVAGAIVRAIKSSNMPNGVFSNLNSNGIEVGVKLVNHPKIKAVGFTGSIRGGRALFDIANQRPEPIPMFAEMGSINPVIITQQALESKGEQWAQTYADSITLGTGQFCTNPGLILGIESNELTEFSTSLAREIVQKESTCMLHPAIKEAYARLKEEALNQEGVKQLTNTLTVATNYADQTVITVDGSTFLNNPTLHHEVFGPFSVVVQCKSRTELLTIIEGLEGQLTGTIIADEGDDIVELIDVLQQRVGRIIYNGVPTGVEVCASMHHGGPYPATTDARFTAVGPHAIKRWIRPITYQNFPKALLPRELQ